MTKCFKPAGGDWIVIDRQVVLPGFADLSGVVDDWTVSPAWAESLTDEQAEQLGLVDLVDPGASPPEGQRRAGVTVEDVEGVPTCVYSYEPIPVSPLPAEIPMHKAQKALAMLGPDGAVDAEEDVSWFDLVEEAIASVAHPVQRRAIRIEWDRAQNLVLAGATTGMIRGEIGMSDEQLDAVARLALTLP